MKKRYSISIVLITFLILTSCSSSDDSSAPENLPEDESFDLTPPSWILGEWYRLNSDPNIGYEFLSNDIILANGIGDEVSFIELRNEAIEQGYEYILIDELETSTEYHVYTETIDPATGQTLAGTFPHTWKWRMVCPNAIIEGTQESERFRSDDNPNLILPSTNLTIDLTSSEYSQLGFPGNHIILESQGLNGIVIYNVNNELFTAFDLSDPNHELSSCSEMTVFGIVASSECPGENQYDVVTGNHLEDLCLYPMGKYKVTKTGNELLISNY